MILDTAARLSPEPLGKTSPSTLDFTKAGVTRSDCEFVHSKAVAVSRFCYVYETNSRFECCSSPIAHDDSPFQPAGALSSAGSFSERPDWQVSDAKALDGVVRPKSLVVNFHPPLVPSEDVEGACSRVTAYLHGSARAAAQNGGQRSGKAWPVRFGLTTPTGAIPGRHPGTAPRQGRERALLRPVVVVSNGLPGFGVRARANLEVPRHAGLWGGVVQLQPLAGVRRHDN